MNLNEIKFMFPGLSTQDNKNIIIKFMALRYA